MLISTLSVIVRWSGRVIESGPVDLSGLMPIPLQCWHRK